MRGAASVSGVCRAVDITTPLCRNVCYWCCERAQARTALDRRCRQVRALTRAQTGLKQSVQKHTRLDSIVSRDVGDMSRAVRA